MYILVVARDFPKKNSPLRGIFEFDQAKALQNFGHKIVYVSVDLRSFRRKRKLGKYWTKVDGITIINLSIPLGKIPQNWSNKIGMFFLSLCYNDIHKRYGKPDIIHAHFSGIGLMASVLKEKFSVPLIITEHSSEVIKQTPSKRQKKIMENAYSKADYVLAVSSPLAKKLKLYWDINAYIVPNVVDTSAFHFNERRKKNNFIFLSIGNLISGKGFDVLIKAFKKADFDQNVQLSIIGKGPEHNKLQQLIDLFGLRDQIRLLGFLNRNRISEVMQECDAFVLASHYETFGVVYIEAMLTGLPIIATACGGPEDFINSENGLLVPVNDVNSLADALRTVNQSINNFNKKAISKNCQKKFSPATIASQLTDIFKNILNKN